jgi:tetratricopeptide (TPR) repeat protein
MRCRWTRYSQLVLMIATVLTSPPPLDAQPAPQAPNSANAAALEIISAWQNSSRGATPRERAQLIEKAIALALAPKDWPFKDPPREALLGQMWGQLGNEYRRIEGPDKRAMIERAIVAYTEAQKLVPQSRADDWSRVQFGLGSSYMERLDGTRADNVERAIVAFGRVGEVVTRDKAPGLWSSLQVALSKAYWHRIAGVRADNLETSIKFAEAALSATSKEKTPGDWSEALQAVGAAYWGRIRGIRADNIEKALGAYEQALSVLSRERSAKAWAGTHDNIGMAYAVRERGDRRENLIKAQSAFNQAELVFKRERYPADWAQLQMNLGNLLIDTELSDDTRAIEAAIVHFKAALEVYTEQQNPERSARVALNLGNAFRVRIEGDRADNIEQAIAASRAALRYYTRQNDPLKWATAQSGLGFAHKQRTAGGRQENLKAALAAIEAALTVFTPLAYPRQHLDAAYQAGEVAAAQGHWSAASEYYERAISASRVLFAEGVSPVSARALLSSSGQLFSAAAYAAIQRGKLDEALNVLDSGRARLLNVSLGLDALPLTLAERARLDTVRRDINAIEATLDQLQGDERLSAIRALEDLRRSLDAIASVAAPGQSSDPTRMPAVDVSAQLLTRYAALALPVFTPNGSVLVLVTKGLPRPRIQTIPVPPTSSAAIKQLFYDNGTQGGTGGWFAAYNIARLPAAEQIAQRPKWETAIDGMKVALGRLIGEALFGGLRDAGVAEGADVIWVPQGELGQVPIGLAATGTGAPSLLDRYTVTIAPSLAAAEVSRRRALEIRAAPSLVAVINPTGDLPSTVSEGLAVSSFFPGTARTLGPSDATQANVLQALAKSSYWHFATHGLFKPSRPRDSALRLAGGASLTMGALLDETRLGTARLVVLSACETGLAELRDTPDEFNGLPTAFLQAGAAGVVATLWPVDDIATALVMMRFYDLHAGAGRAPAAALRQAQIWLRDASRRDLLAYVEGFGATGRLNADHVRQLSLDLQGPMPADRPFAHPLYWAPFQFYGG